MQPDDTLKDQLVEIARKLATDKGWAWHEPVEVKSSAHRGEGTWEILTNTLMRGQNVRVVVRRSDHAVLSAGYLPR